MKFGKLAVLACSLFMATGCVSNQGVALTVENANTYIQPLVENNGNANFDNTNVSFNLYPNSEAGKLFSSDIVGKCTLTVKYLKGIDTSLHFIWSDPVDVTNIAFAYKEGGTVDGNKQLDSLHGTFPHNVEFTFTMVNIYNLRVTEISGHMLP